MLAQSLFGVIRIGALVGLLSGWASTVHSAPDVRPGSPRRATSRATSAKGRLEAAFDHLERLLRAHARSVGACGPRQFYLAVSRQGSLRMLSVLAPDSDERCGILGTRSGDDITKVRVNVHNLAKVGAPPGRGRVTLHCRPSATRCVTLTLADRRVLREDRVVLVLQRDPAAVAAVARAALRFRWLVKNDWRYTRPSTKALRHKLRSAGRPLRNWGLVLTIGGVACLATGGALLGYAQGRGLGAALFYGTIGAPILLTGIVAALVGLPVLIAGINRLEQARFLEREAGDSDQSALPRPTTPAQEQWALARRLCPFAVSAPLSLALRLRF